MTCVLMLVWDREGGDLPPDLAALPPGCAFAARCALASDACRAAQPMAVRFSPTHQARCIHTEQAAAMLAAPA